MKVRRIANPDEVGTLTYANADRDYAEVRYDTGYHFRTRLSEWEESA